MPWQGQHDFETSALAIAQCHVAAILEDEAVAWRYCSELLQTREVSDAILEATQRQFGEQGVVDRTGECGSQPRLHDAEHQQGTAASRCAHAAA